MGRGAHLKGLERWAEEQGEGEGSGAAVGFVEGEAGSALGEEGAQVWVRSQPAAGEGGPTSQEGRE